jgi:hypothetical protein
LIIDSLVDDRDALDDITSALASVGFDRQLVFDHHRPAASSGLCVNIYNYNKTSKAQCRPVVTLPDN